MTHRLTTLSSLCFALIVSLGALFIFSYTSTALALSPGDCFVQGPSPAPAGCEEIYRQANQNQQSSESVKPIPPKSYPTKKGVKPPLSITTGSPTVSTFSTHGESIDSVTNQMKFDNDAIYIAQTMLMYLGYLDAGQVNGELDASTVSAIKKFQCDKKSTSNNLPCDGTGYQQGYGAFDGPTVTALNQSYNNLPKNTYKYVALNYPAPPIDNVSYAGINQRGANGALDSGDHVYILQVILYYMGYLEQDSITGYFDDNTRNALATYQCDKGVACSFDEYFKKFGGPGDLAPSGWAALGDNRMGFARIFTTDYQLIKQGIVSGATSPEQFTWLTYLRRSTTGPNDQSYSYSVNVLYLMMASLGRFTGIDTPHYTELAESIVQKFQCDKGIVCSGTPETTGYGATGPATRAALITEYIKVNSKVFSRRPQGGSTNTTTNTNTNTTINTPTQPGASHSCALGTYWDGDQCAKCALPGEFVSGPTPSCASVFGKEFSSKNQGSTSTGGSTTGGTSTNLPTPPSVPSTLPNDIASLEKIVAMLQQYLTQLIEAIKAIGGTTGGTTQPGSGTGTSGTSYTYTDNTKNITITQPHYLNETGPAVANIQIVLAKLGYYPKNAITGVFDLATQNAVKKFQCDKGLVCSGTDTSTGYGRVGPSTAQRLNDENQKLYASTSGGATGSTGGKGCFVQGPSTECAPTTPAPSGNPCTWQGGIVYWNQGNITGDSATSCSVNVPRVTVQSGQTSQVFTNSKSGFSGTVAFSCNNGQFKEVAPVCKQTTGTTGSTGGSSGTGCFAFGGSAPGTCAPTTPSTPSNDGSCSWTGGNVSWNQGNITNESASSCMAYMGPVTVKNGQSTITYGNTKSGFWGSVGFSCKDGKFTELKPTCGSNSGSTGGTSSSNGSCAWTGGTVYWDNGNIKGSAGAYCEAYMGPVTVQNGQSSISYGNTKGGYAGSVSFTCNNGQFREMSPSCTSISGGSSSAGASGSFCSVQGVKVDWQCGSGRPSGSEWTDVGQGCYHRPTGSRC